MADPIRVGGFDNLEFGLAEYAEGDAPRTFITYTLEKWIVNRKSSSTASHLMFMVLMETLSD